MAKVVIIYATGGGNTQLVCEKVGEVLTSQRHTVSLIRAQQARYEELTAGDLLILASPTYEHGMVDRRMWLYYKRVADKGIDLTDVKCAVIGLGDDKYDIDYHIEAAALLTDFIREHHGQIVIPALRINQSPIPYLETRVVQWAGKLGKLV